MQYMMISDKVVHQLEIDDFIEKLIPVNDYEDYSVSNTGKVFSSKNGTLKELKPIKNCRKGYYCVHLSKNNKAKEFYIHRLVFEHHVRKLEEGEQINHIDFNKSFNSTINLEVCTNKQNLLHALKGNRLNRQLYVYDKRNKVKHHFYSMQSASLHFGYSKNYFFTNVSRGKFTNGTLIWELLADAEQTKTS